MFRGRVRGIPDDRRFAGGYGAAMAQTGQVRVDLEIGHESISGSLIDAQGRSSSFEGWLGLIGLVERARATLGSRGADDQRDGPTAASCADGEPI
jgi:hypothetical protein